jgi:hypothetical protein
VQQDFLNKAQVVLGKLRLSIGVQMKTKWIVSISLLLLIFGCASCSHSTTIAPNAPAPEVFRKWKEHHDYYALLEIVDAYIDPNLHEASKADVLKYLGHGIDTPDDYPNAGPKLWVYESVRRRCDGLDTYLLVEFDERDIVKTIFWGSE